jgi:hypothetical protein
MVKILKIAWRNILAHKAKTLIIGILVLVSSFLFVLANSFPPALPSGAWPTPTKLFDRRAGSLQEHHL